MQQNSEAEQLVSNIFQPTVSETPTGAKNSITEGGNPAGVASGDLNANLTCRGKIESANYNNNIVGFKLDGKNDKLYCGSPVLYNGSVTPTAPAVVGQLAVINGVLYICTIAGTPGIWTSVTPNTPKTFVITDNIGRSFTTTWSDGPTFATKTIRDGFGVKLDLNIPVRNDSTSWGGGYLELQVSVNGGGFVSMGSGGYDMAMCNTSDWIGTYAKSFVFNRIDIGAAAVGDFTLAIKLRARSYDTVLYWNSQNGIGSGGGAAAGAQFYTTLIMQEVVNG